MQTIKLLVEENIHLNLIAYPFRLFTFCEWAETSMFTLSFTMVVRLFLWFPKIFLEKFNKRQYGSNMSYWPKALCFQILAFPLLFMFFSSFDKNTNLWSFIDFSSYTLEGFCAFLSGAFYHLLYQIMNLLGDWLKKDFNWKGIGHLLYLVISIPIVCILEGMTEKSGLHFASLSITFLSILTYLVAYVIENLKEFQYSWDVFGNKKFIGG